MSEKSFKIKSVQLLGPAPPSWFVSDGCTMVPDKWRSLNWKAACDRHDWHYSGHVKISRLMADVYLFVNMIKLRAPWKVALAYFLGVRWFGKSHYTSSKTRNGA